MERSYKISKNNLGDLIEENFHEKISTGIAIVYFWALKDRRCKEGMQYMANVKQRNLHLNFARLEVNGNNRIIFEYDLGLLPTVIIFKEGEEYKRIVGLENIRKIDETIKKLN